MEPPQNPYQTLIQACSLAGQERGGESSPPNLQYQATYLQHGGIPCQGRSMAKPHVNGDKNFFPTSLAQ
ncbi:unnamed protein product [Staurois parvus]|uniref:Uncharacterized protein n=1 Tax=Staurois parvus TaxID=386267 RepID=A0ABN9ECJ8_9NEOB|nr:unnamed protein product [Staurois parvus]